MQCWNEHVWDDYFQGGDNSLLFSLKLANFMIYCAEKSGQKKSENVTEIDDETEISATELDSVESNCYTFASKEMFSSDCIPFTKEFLSDFLCCESSSGICEETGTKIESNTSSFEAPDGHRTFTSEACGGTGSNRAGPDLTNYWLYQNRDNVSWKDQEDIDSSLSSIRCKRKLQRYANNYGSK
jgi:hypothetical protein